MRKLCPGQRLYAALVLAHVAVVKRFLEIGCDNTSDFVIMTASMIMMKIESIFTIMLMIECIIITGTSSMFAIITMTISDMSTMKAIDIKSSPEP